MEYTVTQLNSYIKNMFINDFGLNNIYVKGEVSNLKYHTSGHIYFTLKDMSGMIACVMFAGQRKGLKFRMEEGQSVAVYGSVSIYERDGKYQLYAREIVLDGLGILYQRYEELKKILSIKGLFNNEHKKKIGKFNKNIGIVTASTAAALQDIINISKRRNPYVNLILAPAIVQGENAVESIIKGIKCLDRKDLDVIIVGRGGGSIEDLWAFNSEDVAKTVYECKTPIISAVGHETDTTIIDYVADLRAPTPSAAAELAVFDYKNFENALNEYSYTLSNIMDNKITLLKNKLDNISLRLEHVSIEYKMQQYKQKLADEDDRLNNIMKDIVLKKKHCLDIYVQKMIGLSPLNIMKKGYSYVQNDREDIINSIENVKDNDKIKISLIDGNINAKIISIDKKAVFNEE